MAQFQVEVPYIGGILSKNSSKYPLGRGLKPFVKMWMKELRDKVKSLEVPTSQVYRIGLYGKFTDERRPDLANLHEVIGDALKGPGCLGVDDRQFIFEDKGWELGYFDPTLIISIEPIGVIDASKE